MHEALSRSFGTTLDIVHDEGGPPITRRTSGLSERVTLLAFVQPSLATLAQFG